MNYGLLRKVEGVRCKGGKLSITPVCAANPAGAGSLVSQIDAMMPRVPIAER